MSDASRENRSEYYLNLIGKEDFNNVRPSLDGLPTKLELKYLTMEALSPEGGYGFVLKSTSVTADDREYLEGQIEGNAIRCSGSHFSEGDKGELRITLKSEKVNRVRFAVDAINHNSVSAYKYFDKAGKELGSIDSHGGWIDFQLSPEESEQTSIGYVSVFLTVNIVGPLVDSLEMWRWNAYS
ncbi:hypothetical protein [Pseudomonas sp. BGI-2]|uniref:hypothetical protein n=1 Tax=Pseudomonas sp. BGI-2 TaxID=2528211 RepID=UPI001034D6B3|nr:hypothetical protein [Pseudomonas sp. BGI-2]TBN44458.1 hypothetical protein EYC95_15475 [Pseudomonas sp. BGI-2]